MDVQQQALLTLVRSGLTGETLPIPEGVNYKQLYQGLTRHQLLAVGYLGGVNCGLPKQEPLMTRLFQDYCRCLQYSERQQSLIDRVCAAFDRAGVDYMPLKGCNLKGVYPAPELRSMGDADILIRVEQYDDSIRPIITELGFTAVAESDHELIWQKGNLLLELHKRLIPSYNKDYYRYFGDGWQLATVQDGTRWSMKREDELIYLFTHFAKHYRDGGIGLRHLADLWVFLRAYPGLDMEYIKRELKKLCLLEFYGNVARTADAWFGQGEWDEVTDVIIARICDSGAYGTREGHDLFVVARDAGENKTVNQARFARAMHMVFQPLSEMKKKHPVLQKMPVLLPVFWVARIFAVVLFRRNRLKKAAHEFHTANTQTVNHYRQEMDFVGLNFNFEE